MNGPGARDKHAGAYARPMMGVRGSAARPTMMPDKAPLCPDDWISLAGHPAACDSSTVSVAMSREPLAADAIALVCVGDWRLRRRVSDLTIVDRSLIDATPRVAAVVAHEVTLRVALRIDARLRLSSTAAGHEADDRQFQSHLLFAPSFTRRSCDDLTPKITSRAA